MSGFPHCALVRSYVLNNLENGPARVADLIRRGQAEFGFSHSEIEAAAKHFAVVTRVKKGEIYWMRPANLIAIWWGLGRDPSPFDALPLNGDRSRGLNARSTPGPPKRLRCRELRDDVVAERCLHRGFQRSRPYPPSSAQLRWHIG